MRGMGAALFTRGASAACQLYVSLAIAHLSGPTGLGAFYVYLAWSQVTAAVGHLGLPTHSLRETSVLLTSERYGEAGALWRRALTLVVSASVLLACLASLFGAPLARHALGDASLRAIVVLGSWSAIPLALVTLAAETLKGYGRSVAALTLQYMGAPLVMALYATVSVFLKRRPADLEVLAVYSVALSVAAALGVLVVFRMQRRRSLASRQPQSFRELHAMPWPVVRDYWAVGLLGQAIAGVPFLLLAHVAPRHEVGLYGAADRLTSVAPLILVAVVSMYAPRFAAASERRNAQELRRLLRESQIYATAAYVPVLALYCFGGSWAMRLFGGAFEHGVPILTVLATGQLANTVTGAVVYFNYMTGQERFERQWSLGVLGLLATTTILLAKSWGAMGVAIAVAGVTIVKNVGSYLRARRTITNLTGIAD